MTELQHVLVLSDDIDGAAEFYERALGLRIGERPPFEFTGIEEINFRAEIGG